MNEFSEFLKNLLDFKEMTVHDLANLTNIDRPNMYKIVQGKRLPRNTKVIKNIADGLMLTTSERENFYSMYKISLMGRDNYFRWKNVNDFLLTDITRKTFPGVGEQNNQIWNDEKTLSADCERPLIADGEISISGRRDIQRIIINAINQEAKSGGIVRLIMNPDNEMFSFISTIFGNNDSLKIEHIITLSNNRGLMNNSEDYNLYCMIKVLTLYTESNNYNAYYCYKRGRGSDIGLSVFPYMVLLSDSMILLSDDCESALYFNNKETIRLGNQIWNRMFGDVSSLAEKKYDILSFLELLEEQTQSDSSVCYVYQFFPNAILWMNDELFQTYINCRLNVPTANHETELKYAEELKDKAFRQRAKFEQVETYAYCSLAKIRYFLDTGLVDELPSDYYGEIPKKDRIEIVKRICDHPANYHLRLLKKEQHIHHGYPGLFLTDRRGYITINKNEGIPIFFTFTEPLNLLAFREFFINADDSFCYKDDISIQKIKELVQEYETELQKDRFNE